MYMYHQKCILLYDRLTLSLSGNGIQFEYRSFATIRSKEMLNLYIA